METIWLWIGFLLLVFFFLALDLGVFNRKAHVPGIRESIAWTVFWICMALLFNVAIYFMYEHHLLHIGEGEHTASGVKDINGLTAAKLFFTGYIIEKSLSLDNIFVIGIVFSFFGVPAKYQHRVLFWGIFGALLLRGIMIVLGVALIQMFQPILYFFGALLVFTAIKMFNHKAEEVHPENNPVVKFAKKYFRVTKDYHEDHFFRKENGLWAVTPMFLVLLVVESNDVVFAIDSIPAIFAITTDPFIVFTSNVFAILGLRSLYFVLAAMIAKFKYLSVSLAVILGYVGVKLLCLDVIHHFHIEEEMTWISLGVIFVTMTVGIIASIYAAKKEDKSEIKLEHEA